MAKESLDNLIRSYRKRVGLSQEEMAWLLGLKDRSNASRHERGKRSPRFEKALAYEIILGRPARELYREVFRGLAKDVGRRALKLLEESGPGCLKRVHSDIRLNELKRIVDDCRKHETGHE